MNILSVDFDKINLDDVDFYEDDPEALIHVRLLTWYNKFEKQKACKKDKKTKELMHVAWHPTRWWDWRLPVKQKKEVEPFFTDKVGKWEKLVEGLKMLLAHAGSIWFGGIGTFWDKTLRMKTCYI